MQLSLLKTPLFWIKHQQQRLWTTNNTQRAALPVWFTLLKRQSVVGVIDNQASDGTGLSEQGNKKGQVVFVGAGAGDPELLTLKAVKAFQQADVVLVDWLVNPEINSLIPNHVERIFVGKKCGQHSVTQAQICQLLADYASQGKYVVRLKGGDPSIFARLAEETDVLTKANIPFQIIPGITAATGCAAYAGIPLTHRDCAQSVKFVTAHGKRKEHECDWPLLAKEQSTLVFYMGLNRVDLICQRLISHGMDARMPIAVIDQGTSDSQKLVCRTLSSMNAEQDLAECQGPALIIVGEVVEKRVRVNLAITGDNAQSANQVSSHQEVINQ
ncbi:uroporphyrinogen-III C-methyltransferase [Thalassotalea euphylliae]|uniref:uroporphyrinogen-III C-methyltransferase n=1 Tax=Thalassotalea euphylliae TaxID=1655234 RepID=A0A3E0TQ98_9GAMM|nr:uroporphyrinogen-III C-methyltransferase [Thalassotalea euphylliae]REL26766.1 uroporphyrinogen-III C-methyltransferase [Thalassotalea euphylliae]